jgi:hypothetical protein
MRPASGAPRRGALLTRAVRAERGEHWPPGAHGFGWQLVDTGSGNVGMTEPLLHLGDVGLGSSALVACTASDRLILCAGDCSLLI